MLAAWDQLQDADLEDVADVIFAQFKKPRFPDEVEAGLLYAEHMLEVGHYSLIFLAIVLFDYISKQRWDST